MSGQQDGEALFPILSQRLKLVKRSVRIAWLYWK